MDVVENLADLDSQAKALKMAWNSYDFFFIHHKTTDSKGEDGDFEAKVREIEKVDAFLPGVLALQPDLIIVTGDHSTPATAGAHTSHPVPFLIAGDGVRADRTRKFGERTCASGIWGTISGQVLIRLALAYTGKLKKFGA
jgi:2,3-bisphosphoglycerate-independent phosphoglycerate mutase